MLYVYAEFNRRSFSFCHQFEQSIKTVTANALCGGVRADHMLAFSFLDKE